MPPCPCSDPTAGPARQETPIMDNKAAVFVAGVLVGVFVVPRLRDALGV